MIKNKFKIYQNKDTVYFYKHPLQVPSTYFDILNADFLIVAV